MRPDDPSKVGTGVDQVLRELAGRGCRQARARAGASAVALLVLHIGWTAATSYLLWGTTLAASRPAAALFVLIWAALMAIPVSEVAHYLVGTAQPRSFAGLYVNRVRAMVLNVVIGIRSLSGRARC